uniref:Uncharacterized protein n=1 Tax=Sphaerodactylus townsendi TaxID=933632 RepID=A0ACB8G1F8_9SAUR
MELDLPNTGVNKLRTSESVHITSYHVGTEPEQGNLYSPEQTSLHERSVGNSRSSTQMNSYSDSGYQETSNIAANRAMRRRPASPVAVRRMGSVTSRQPTNSNGSTPQYQSSVRVGSPLSLNETQTRLASPPQTQVGSASPKRSGMTAVPQHLGTTLQRTIHDIEQYAQQYDIYERMVPPRPDSLTG